MMDLAKPISAFEVHPLGSNRVWENFWQNSFSGTPYCGPVEMASAKEFMSSPRVEPSLAMLMKSSPGWLLGGDPQNRSWKVLKKGGILVSIDAPPSAEEAAKHGVRSA